MKVCLFGRGGKVGSVLAPALEGSGHELAELPDAEVAVDFTAPGVVGGNVRRALEAGVPAVVEIKANTVTKLDISIDTGIR